MANRKPETINECLKAKEYALKTNAIDGTVVITGIIKEIKDVKTKFDKGENSPKVKIVIQQHNENNTLVDVFVNNFSLTELCEKFGDEDKNWIGKDVKVTKETDKKYNSPMFIIRANEETV